MTLVKIGEKKVGGKNPCFIIAEAGSNHNGDIKLAKKMILKAKEIGCDCIKFQTYKAENFCADKNKKFKYKSQNKIVTESEYEMFKRLEFTDKEWEDLVKFSKKNKILFLTTIQDKPNLGPMLKLGIKAIKIGSDDFNYKQNLKTFAKTGLPLILSRGMSTLKEIKEIISFLRPINKNILIMHCVSEYPVNNKDLNLLQIRKLKNEFPDIIWGFSDHSIGTLASTIAVSLGAKIIEKHFTLDHNLPGPDHWFSSDSSEMKYLVKTIRDTESLLGEEKIKISKNEEKIKNLSRRKIVALKDLFKGDLINERNITFKRANKGIQIEHWEKIKGKKIKKNKRKNQVINYKDL